jgi:hypothetical protein
MDSLITAAAQALAMGDPLGAGEWLSLCIVLSPADSIVVKADYGKEPVFTEIPEQVPP